MSLPRFLVDALPDGGIVELSEAEARHASNVLRLAVGANIHLFDGAGGEAKAVIHEVGKRTVRVALVERTDADRELPFPLELLVALPKGDRQKTLIDALVQLGVTQLTPLICQRGVVQPHDGALLRLERAVVEASKQCGRNRFLAIAEPISVNAVPLGQHEGTLALFAHPYGNCRTLSSVASENKTPTNARVIIGPEGGLTDSECEVLRGTGWQQVSLGPRILRIETAAMMIAAWWSAR